MSFLQTPEGSLKGYETHETPINATTASMPKQGTILEATGLRGCGCRLSLSSNNQVTTMQSKLMEEVSFSRLLKESGEGRFEYEYSIPNPTS
jgi:hypothetical protein